MSTVIDHTQRKQFIITRSTVLFTGQGFSVVACHKIADSCGSFQTILCTYLENIREFFTERVDFSQIRKMIQQAVEPINL